MSRFVIKHNEQGNYPCKIKRCQYKKRNGRCSLNLITFLTDGRCMSYRVKVGSNGNL